VKANSRVGVTFSRKFHNVLSARRGTRVLFPCDDVETFL
jgi:hypothetical protein